MALGQLNDDPFLRPNRSFYGKARSAQDVAADFARKGFRREAEASDHGPLARGDDHNSGSDHRVGKTLHDAARVQPAAKHGEGRTKILARCQHSGVQGTWQFRQR